MSDVVSTPHVPTEAEAADLGRPIHSGRAPRHDSWERYEAQSITAAPEPAPFVSPEFVAEIEVVAKAIAAQASMNDDEWDDMPEGDRAFWRACAIAASTALDKFRSVP